MTDDRFRMRIPALPANVDPRMVDISRLDRVEVLRALYSTPSVDALVPGFSFFEPGLSRPRAEAFIAWHDAEQQPLGDIDGHAIRGRIEGQYFDPIEYDKVRGTGTAKAVIAELRSRGGKW